MNKEITIGIADDHPFTRLGLLSALKPHKNIRVLFDVGDGKQLLDKLKTLKPDILMLDIEMPIMKAQDVLEKINNKYPKIKVIIISAFFQTDYIIECFSLKVKAFLPKGEPIEEVLNVINIVNEKGIYMQAEVAKILTDELSKNNSDKKSISWTSKEKEVLEVLCKTASSKKTADILGISLDGLNYHLRKIMNKTNINNTKELIKYVIENKIVRSNL